MAQYPTKLSEAQTRLRRLASEMALAEERARIYAAKYGPTHMLTTGAIRRANSAHRSWLVADVACRLFADNMSPSEEAVQAAAEPEYADGDMYELYYQGVHIKDFPSAEDAAGFAEVYRFHMDQVEVRPPFMDALGARAPRPRLGAIVTAILDNGARIPAQWSEDGRWVTATGTPEELTGVARWEKRERQHG